MATKARRPKKRRGRDQEADLEARLAPKSRNINFRTRPFVYDRLRDAAAAAARSVSEEIEYRLNQTFTDDDLLKVLAYGKRAPETLKLIRLILATINVVEVQEKADVSKPGMLDVRLWHEDPKRAQELFETLVALERAILISGIRPLESAEDYTRELSAATAGASGFRSKAEFKAWYVLLSAGFVSRAPQQSVAELKADLRNKIDELHRRLEYIESVEQMDERHLQTVYFEAHNGQNDAAGRKSEAQGSVRDQEAQTREKT
jgi:hypothetical protein